MDLYKTTTLCHVRYICTAIAYAISLKQNYSKNIKIKFSVLDVDHFLYWARYFKRNMNWGECRDECG